MSEFNDRWSPVMSILKMLHHIYDILLNPNVNNSIHH